MDSTVSFDWLLDAALVNNWGACLCRLRTMEPIQRRLCLCHGDRCQLPNCSEQNQISLDHSSHIHSSLILAVTSSSCAPFAGSFFPTCRHHAACRLLIDVLALRVRVAHGSEMFFLSCAALTTRAKPFITRSILWCECDGLREFTSLLRVFSVLHFSSLFQSCKVLVRQNSQTRGPRASRHYLLPAMTQ